MRTTNTAPHAANHHCSAHAGTHVQASANGLIEQAWLSHAPVESWFILEAHSHKIMCSLLACRAVSLCLWWCGVAVCGRGAEGTHSTASKQCMGMCLSACSLCRELREYEGYKVEGHVPLNLAHATIRAFVAVLSRCSHNYVRTTCCAPHAVCL